MESKLINLSIKKPIWAHFYMVAPLVVIGTKEGEAYNLAPKHMACPLGSGNYFGFVCTPRHHTYRNILSEKVFTVSFPKSQEIIMTSIAASPRCHDSYTESMLSRIPHFMSPGIDAPMVKNSYLYLDCSLEKVVGGFDEYCLIAGKITGAYLDPAYKVYAESDHQKMIYDNPLLAYLPDKRFAIIKKTLAFPFPEGFKK